MEIGADGLEVLYSNRFGEQTDHRLEVWRILCSQFFQRYVPEDAVVLDIAAGHCEFINNITAARKIAIDLNPDVKRRANLDVETHLCRSDRIVSVSDGSIDVVFISNFFEHVTREVILSTLIEVRRVLRPDGKLLILQPNVRYCARDYWQFFDHITPVDDRALSEALVSMGYTVELCVPRFVPYTTRRRLRPPPWTVAAYLRIPLAWRIFGAQAFVVASVNSR